MQPLFWKFVKEPKMKKARAEALAFYFDIVLPELLLEASNPF
jgi:hypothetical protein